MLNNLINRHDADRLLRKVRKLDMHQLPNIHSLPLITNQQVLIG